MRFFLILIITFTFFLNSKAKSFETYIVYKVNNEIITNVDIDIEYRYLIALNKNLKKLSKKRIIQLAKESILREKIKKTEIEKFFDLSQENKFIDRIIKNFYVRLGIENENDFKLYLLNYNLSFNDVKKKITIEAAWNDLVYKKYSRQIEINEEKIKDEINKMILNNKKQNIYFLSEILFNVDKSKDLEKKYSEIKKSISEDGFENAANIHSITDSAKLGGKIGWVNDSQISKIIKKEIEKLEIGELTNPIAVPGGLLILKLNDKKIEEKKLNFKEEYNKKITFERNSQLDNFSKIYYKKIKTNSVISEL